MSTPADGREYTDPAQLARDERAARALRLRLTGASYQAIADQLGCSIDTVARDIGRWRREVVREPAEQMVAEQRAMLANLRQRAYTLGLQGDMAAIDRVVKLLDHEAKLFGLYSPTRVALGTVEEDFAVTAAKLMREIGVVPPAELDRAPAPDAPAVTGPTVLDAEVVEEIAAVGPEGPDDAWVR